MEEQRNPTVASNRDGRVERSVLLPAAPALVWESLTNEGDLSSWFGAEVQMDVRPRGRATFRWPDGLERGAVLEEIDPGRRLAFRWLPFAWIDGQTRPVPPGRVEFLLEEEGEGTKLTVTEWASWPGSALLARPEWPGPLVVDSFRRAR
jgi:uncharacterized protein YndB with AHSA1/START domain